MTEVIGVRFQRTGTITYVDPNGEKVAKDEGVIVATDRGVEYGTIRIENIELPGELLPPISATLLRRADAADRETVEENKRLAKDALALCAIKIEEHQLDMKLVDAEYTFDRDKLIFYFTAEDRVDFRSLVRDLAQSFHTRIGLRQIGVRDQAKMIGGLGQCGQPVCCRRYLSDFIPVSIKMAKTQGLSLNPTKISGVCGRLMCCLNYEQDHYLSNTKRVPAKGTLVLTKEGQGYVVDRDVLQTRVRVHVYKPDGSEDEKYYYVSDIEVLARRKKGQPRPELRDEEELQEHEFVTEGEKAEHRKERAACPACHCKPSKENAAVVMTSEEVSITEVMVSDDHHVETMTVQEMKILRGETNETKEPYAQKGRVKARSRRRGRHR